MGPPSETIKKIIYKKVVVPSFEFFSETMPKIIFGKVLNIQSFSTAVYLLKTPTHLKKYLRSFSNLINESIKKNC